MEQDGACNPPQVRLVLCPGELPSQQRLQNLLAGLSSRVMGRDGGGAWHDSRMLNGDTGGVVGSFYRRIRQVGGWRPARRLRTGVLVGDCLRWRQRRRGGQQAALAPAPVREIRSSKIQERRTLLQGEGGASRQLAWLMTAPWIVARGKSRCCRCPYGTGIRATPRRLAPGRRPPCAPHPLSRPPCLLLASERGVGTSSTRTPTPCRETPAASLLPSICITQQVIVRLEITQYRAPQPVRDTCSGSLTG